MDETITATGLPPAFPDHTQLPDEDGTFVKNFQEHPQSIILTDSIGPVVERLHPDGQYAIGQDCGIYWRETDPPERGAEAPDWFYIPNVPATLDGFRRSYVLWPEHMAPFIALEFASGNGEEERDGTPLSVAADGTTTKPGKFWVYERIIRIPYYGIYEMRTGNLEVYHLIDFVYRKMEPNERGHYPIPVLDVELGLWEGSYQNQELLWLRWWDSQGNLLLTGSEQVEIERALVEQERERVAQERERAEQERERAEQERERAEQKRERAEQAERKVTQLAERLRAMGIDPDAED
ncbi:Uma2 family endonuclease [Microcoleus sp. AR_TQ3_B6]|uniref:Uma2 family endonuclease n=1 Tax=Microcoleus sp. AR_TQ3_B6 TaxID=3055284 RepID=UPI002FD4B3C2